MLHKELETRKRGPNKVWLTLTWLDYRSQQASHKTVSSHTPSGNPVCQNYQYLRPTVQADPVTKELFYGEFKSLLQETKNADKVFIQSNFNERFGKDYTIWPGVHGIGSCNENGQLLLLLCAEHSLNITNTLFQQKARLKTNWRHPRSNYILVRQRREGCAAHQSNAEHRLLHRLQTSSCHYQTDHQAHSEEEKSIN